MPVADRLSLELKASGKLQLSRTGVTADSLATTDRSAVDDVTTGIAKVDVVECVVSVDTKLENEFFPKRNILLERHISIEVMWAEYAVATGIAYLIQSWLRERAA